jgi:cysteinyl-tRNA synthetase
LKVAAKSQSVASELQDRIITLLRDDLATPQALALLWETVRDEDLPPKQAWGVVEAADAVLGLNLFDTPIAGPLSMKDLPKDVQNLLEKRASARLAKDFAESDRIRIHIENSGYLVDDTPSGPVLTKKLR